ncbi:MAG: ATP-binding protein [Saprospiraceae bacterium]
MMSKHNAKASYDYVKIKDVFIELDDYQFYHSPVDSENPSPHFLGREDAKTKLKTILSNTSNPSGCYLVTGFRGMGKTSTVREAIRELHNRSKSKAKSISPKFMEIDIALSQSDIQELDILRQLARQIYLQWLKIYGPIKIARRLFYMSFGGLTSLALFIFLIDHSVIWPSWYEDLTAVGSKIHFINIKKSTLISFGFYFYIIIFFVNLLYAGLIFIKSLLQTFSNKVRMVSVSHHDINDRLENLNSRLNARTLQERSVKLTPQAGLTLGFLKKLNLDYSRLGPVSFETKKQLSYEIATPKEIEKELILILEEMHQLRGLISRFYLIRCILSLAIRQIPWFIIIIDELDKIEPDHFNSREDSLSNPDPEDLSQQRQRQKAVAKLLANMKSFLNTAKAKFIFIGGREMFDAALADVSDRESFYSSIFSSVINIESFFKDKLVKHTGVTGMTEAFICRSIIPKQFHFKGAAPDDKKKKYVSDPDNLLKFYQILQDYLKFEDTSSGDLEAKQRKIVFLLQSFFVFLTYRSNGSPKRLIELFEQYIITGDQALSNGNPRIAVILPEERPNSKRLFLRFSFIKQYEISFTSNLYRPYLILNSRHMKQLDDKLLYSSAFILDHILKFHRHAFSWRNIELIPDIILVNKDPNLRFFIEDKLQFLFNMHIRETVNSIFQYKFFAKVSQEIKLLSKVSDLSAAAFNFTLDESYHLKAWYKRNLQVKMQDYQGFEKVLGSQGYIHAIGYLKNILGDLHYYDREYDEAIIYYTGVVQPLRSSMTNDIKLSNHQIALYVRTKLKIGLCLEKIKLHDSAYSIYRTLILNGRRLVGKANLYQEPKSVSEEDKTHIPVFNNGVQWEKPYRRMQLFLRPHIALLDLIEKQRVDGVTCSNLERNMEEYCAFLEIDNRFPATPQSDSEVTRLDRKRIQTLLADYYNNVGSLLYYKNKNFLRLHEKAINGSFGKFFLTEFSSKKANLYSFTQQLYSPSGEMTPSTSVFYPSLSAFIYYETALRELLLPYRNNILLVTTELLKTAQNLKLKKSKENPSLDDNIFNVLTTLIREPYCSILNATILYFIANLISKMGDAVLSSLSKNSTGSLAIKLLDSFLLPDMEEKLEVIQRYLFTSKKSHPSQFFSLNRAIALYHLAALFYRKANREYSYAFQHKKVLYLIKDYLTFFKEEEKAISALCHFCRKRGKDNMMKIEEFATILFKSITATSNVSNRPQMEKFHEVLSVNKKRSSDKFYDKIYVNLSTAPEIREVILIIEEIRLKMYRLEIEAENIERKQIKKLHPRKLLSSYDLISSMFCRMLELKYRSEYNWWRVNFLMARHLGLKSKKKQKTENIDKKVLRAKTQEVMRYAIQKHYNFEHDDDVVKVFLNHHVNNKESELHCLIADSIFCLWEASRIFKNYETSYITNYSFQANAYYKLGNWIELYNKYQQVESSQSDQIQAGRIQKELDDLIGPAASGLMDQYFFYEMAIQSYEHAKQLHRQGKAYKDMNAKMHFLEDDFNDNLTHFGAGTERFRINIGVIDEKIIALRQALDQNSRVYKYGSYFQER